MTSAARRTSKAPATKRVRRAVRAQPASLLPSELVVRAQVAGVNAVEIAANAIEAAIVAAAESKDVGDASAERARLLAENEIAIAQTNAIIEQHGLLGDGLRLF